MRNTRFAMGIVGLTGLATLLSATPALSDIVLPAQCAAAKLDRQMTDDEIKACFAALLLLENFSGNGKLTVINDSHSSQQGAGPKGATGDLGANGGTGATGATGGTGASGTGGGAGGSGATGATGSTGSAGGAGATGATGPKGPVGDRGPKGPPGDPGPPGDWCWEACDR